MRSAITILGIISAMLIIMGSLFKIQHYPGAGMMLILGVTLFAFPFLLLLLIYRIKNRSSSIEMAEGIVQVLTLWFLSISTLFLVQHYPGGGILNLVGQQLLGFVYLPILLVRFFYEKDFRKSVSLLNLAIAFGGFSMLLAYQSSKSILEMYTQNNEMIEKNAHLMGGVHKLELEGDSAQDPRVRELIMDARAVYDSIGSYKRHLIRKTESFGPGRADSTLQLSYSSQKGNYDVPSMILIGRDPATPREGQWSAHRLKQMLQNYRDRLLEKAEEEWVRTLIEKRLSYEPRRALFPKKQPWETAIFYHIPLAGVINTLSSIQSNVLSAAQLVSADLRDGGAGPSN